MTDNLTPTASQPLEEGTCPDLVEALSDAFGVTFQIWPPDARPERLASQPGSSGEALSATLPPDCFPRLTERDGTPELLPVSDEACWLLIPVATNGETEWVATGLFHTQEPSLLLKLAVQFQQREEAQQQKKEIELERESLICQITADFEELAFLRQMAEKLAMAESSLETVEMADSILPHLRERIHAEAVVLISAGQDKMAYLVGRPVLSVGRNALDDKSSSRLVERFRDVAVLQPVVRNRCAGSKEFEDVEGLRSFMLAPMARGKSVLGWLLAINRVHTFTDGPKKPGWRLSRNEFGTNEASLLKSAASVLATHATNVELLRDKDQLLFEMVRALVNSIEAKDGYTCGHSERVASYAKELGSAMGLKARICKRIYLAGLLHDVGKIAVHDSVLSKADKLSDVETSEIKTHPDKGWGILFGLDALDDILAGVLHHHEQWNGKGYPDQLAGENIPLDARILAVADAFDAMTSDRPYRQAMPVEKALSILRSGAGGQWDPTVTEAFLSIIPEILHIRDSYEQREPASRRGYGMLQGLDLSSMELAEGTPENATTH